MMWEVGQKVVVMDRMNVASVVRVTPSGRATIDDGRTFNPDGVERSDGYRRRTRIEAWTPEIQDEIDRGKEGLIIGNHLSKAIVHADRWEREAFSRWGNRTPEAADIEKARRLNAAIREILEIVEAP